MRVEIFDASPATELSVGVWMNRRSGTDVAAARR